MSYEDEIHENYIAEETLSGELPTSGQIDLPMDILEEKRELTQAEKDQMTLELHLKSEARNRLYVDDGSAPDESRATKELSNKGIRERDAQFINKYVPISAELRHH